MTSSYSIWKYIDEIISCTCDRHHSSLSKTVVSIFQAAHSVSLRRKLFAQRALGRTNHVKSIIIRLWTRANIHALPRTLDLRGVRNTDGGMYIMLSCVCTIANNGIVCELNASFSSHIRRCLRCKSYALAPISHIRVFMEM